MSVTNMKEFKGYKYIAKKTFTTKAKAEKYKKTLKYFEKNFFLTF